MKRRDFLTEFGKRKHGKDFYRIDAFSHFSSLEFIDFLEALNGPLPNAFGPILRALPCIYDVDVRLQLMDDTGIDLSILIPLPNIESAPNVYNDPAKALQAAQFINNAIAEIVNAHPGRFLGVATLPTKNVNDMLGEFERAVTQLNAVGGWIAVSPTMKPPDHPDFMPLYAKAVQLGVPLWIHPQRPAIYPDYVGEPMSKYGNFLILGWLHDSSIAMSRIVFANVFGTYPELKIIIHHHGAHIPLWAPRIQGATYDLYDQVGLPTGVPPNISKPYIEHFKNFYVDTVCMGPETAVLKIAYDFFGPDRILFGTDVPFSVNNGKDIALASRYSVEELDVTNKELENIFSNNILKIIPH